MERGDKGTVNYEHVKVLIPVRIEGTLDNTSRMSLFCVDSDDREGIWQAEDVALAEAVRGNNYMGSKIERASELSLLGRVNHVAIGAYQ